jgi:hypothetical protein
MRIHSTGADLHAHAYVHRWRKEINQTERADKLHWRAHYPNHALMQKLSLHGWETHPHHCMIKLWWSGYVRDYLMGFVYRQRAVASRVCTAELAGALDRGEHCNNPQLYCYKSNQGQSSVLNHESSSPPRADRPAVRRAETHISNCCSSSSSSMSSIHTEIRMKFIKTVIY